MKYIEMLGAAYLWKNVGRVELWDFSKANIDKKSRVEAIAKVASICYGKPAKDANKLVERLMTESGGLPSSAFEFVKKIDYSGSHVIDLRNNPNMYTYEEESCLTEFSLKDHRSGIATFMIKAPIFLARQIVRHRKFSFQELSRRYTTGSQIPVEWWAPSNAEAEIYANIYDYEETVYDELIRRGTRPEIARAVLGTGLYTQFWMQGDAAAFKNYFKLRLDEHAQKEHRELAQAMLALIKDQQPALYAKVEVKGWR